MTLCPIALAVGCKSCPIVSVCPAKSIIGDFKEEEDSNDKKDDEKNKKGKKKPK